MIMLHYVYKKYGKNYILTQKQNTKTTKVFKEDGK